MRPVYARAVVGGFAALSLWIALNALYRQDASLVAPARPASALPAIPAANKPALAALNPPATVDTPVIAAIRRELQQRGYPVGGGRGATIDLRQAVLAFQFHAGVPLTGEPDAAALKTVLFSATAKMPSGDAQWEGNAMLVRQTQTALSSLGYSAAAPDGTVSPALRQSIERFERERGLAVSGKLSERMLLELITLTGTALQVAG